MFTRRFRQWGFRKNYNTDQVAKILRLKRGAEAAGESSNSGMWEQDVDYERFERYMKRKAGQLESLETVIQRLRFRCRHPSPALLLQTPKVLEDPEVIFISIRDYVSGSFNTGTWISRDDFSLGTAKYPDVADTVTRIDDGLLTAIQLLNESAMHQAGIVLVEGFSHIEQCLRDNDPETLTMVFKYIIKLCHQWPEVVSLLLKQFVDLATVILPQMHPLREILKRIVSLDPESLKYTISITWKSMLDQFESSLGSTHPVILWLWGTFDQTCVDFVPGLQERIVKNLQELLRYSEAQFSRQDVRTLRVLYYLTLYCTMNDETYATEIITRTNLLETEFNLWGDVDRFRVTKFRLSALITLAYVQYWDDRRELAERHKNQCIDICASLYGWAHPSTVGQLIELDWWLEEWGELSKSAEVEKKISKILQIFSDSEVKTTTSEKRHDWVSVDHVC